MLELGMPYTKAEIVAAFSAETIAVHAFFQTLPADQFFKAPPDVWTPADNLVHLLKSAKPVTVGLRAPKFVLRLRFGKAKHQSTSLAGVRAKYMQIVNAGQAIATSPYVPQVQDNSAASRELILSKWQRSGHSMVDALKNWSEGDLDRLQAPHPLIGNLTLRELLFFTLYHNLHHVNDVRRMLGLSEDEWFENSAES